MTDFLQNHPHSRVFPVPLRHRGHRIAPLTSAGLITVGLIGVIALFFAALVRFETPPVFENNTTVPIAIAGAIAALCVVGCLILWQRHQSEPRREQLRYNALAGHDWLDEDRRAALQIVAPGMVNAGYWSETLEFEPCEAALAATDAKPRSFRSFTVQTRAAMLDDVVEWWGYRTASDYRNMIQSLFGGMHTIGFADEMAMDSDHAATLRAELLALHPGLDESYIDRCLTSVDGQPLHLIWAFDIWRVIALSRLTYMAGIIDAGEAWKNILKASDWLHGMFGSLEEMQQNWALGRSYWNRDPDVAASSIEEWAAYADRDINTWPIRDVPWHRPPNWQPPGVMLEMMN